MNLQKSYIGLDELLILIKMKRSFSISGFNNFTFLDVEYKNNEYHCFYVGDENPIVYDFITFDECKNTLYKILNDVYFDRRSLRLWNKDVPS